MSLLNINQFLVRVEPYVQICEHCAGAMKEIPLTIIDLSLLLMSEKKIVRRYKCNDCRLETLLKK